MDKKTSRKNNTGLTVNWPNEDTFWTIKELHQLNPQFGPEITLRVRITKARAAGTVSIIGDKMNPHGRPEMVCAVCQKDGKVKPATVSAAKAAGIRCGEPMTMVVGNIKPAAQPSPVSGNTTPVNLNPSSATKPVAV